MPHTHKVLGSIPSGTKENVVLSVICSKHLNIFSNVTLFHWNGRWYWSLSMWFYSVAVITCAQHAQGPRFEPGRNHYLLLSTKVFMSPWDCVYSGLTESSVLRFRSVVVITCALRAKGPRFEPERNHCFMFSCCEVIANHAPNCVKLFSISKVLNTSRPCGAMVAHLTPDQKVACSTHVGVKMFWSAIVRLLHWCVKL